MLQQDKTNDLSTFGIFLLVLGQVLPQIDFSIVNVALDLMKRSLETDETGLILIISLYGLSFAALITLGGRLGNNYGKKYVYLLGIVGFCFASAICGFATNIIIMLIGRTLQGVFAAFIIPQILAILHSKLHGKRHRVAIGIYTSIAGLSVIIGQVIGGWIISSDLYGLGWRIAFFINIPICITLVILGYIVIPETKSHEQKIHMDCWGIFWFIICFLCVMIPISLGSNHHTLWWLLILALPCGKILWYIEKSQEVANKKGILPPSFFTTPMVIRGLLGEITVTFAYPGYLFVTALCLQSVIGFTPLESGNTFVALGVMFALGSLMSKVLSQHIGDHMSYMLGSIITIIGFLATIFIFQYVGYDVKFYTLWVATGFIGFGNAIMLTSAYRITLSRVEVNYASEASSALATVQQSCFALGTAFSGAIYSVTLRYGYLIAITIVLVVLTLIILLIGIPSIMKRKIHIPNPK